jgi:hypothetical protein
MLSLHSKNHTQSIIRRIAMPEILKKPVATASAWRGADFKNDTSWIVRMTPSDIDEIDSALKAAKATGKEVTQLTRNEFPIQSLAKRFRAWRDEVTDGRGFVLVRGLPVERYSDVEVRTIFWGIGLHWGTALSQNSYGDLLGDVYDEGVKMGTGKVRGYRTNSFLMFHTDRCDIVGLLCLHKAMAGGISTITSTIAMHNEILRNHPEYLEPLYNGLLYANIEEGGDYTTWRVPIYSVTNGVLSCRCSRNTIESARKMGIAKYTDLEVAAIEYFDEIAAREDLRLDMDLERGDMQLINNYTTVHSRTEYQDFPDKSLRRHMVRLWLKLDERRPVAPHYEKEYNGVKKTLTREPVEA